MTTPDANLPPAPLEAWLPALVALAREAGALTLQWYAPDCAHVDKADGSPVTAADGAAEALIAAGLQRLAPELPLVAEEAASAGPVPAEACLGRPWWLVDPLDGTREFLARNGEFTVNIALVEAGRPVLGVVVAPALDQAWWGAEGLGAWAAEGGGPARPIAVRRLPPEGLTVLGSRSHGNDAALDDYLRGRRVAARAVAGSSLKFCRLAEGRADLYPRFGRTMAWDTAAGHAVLRAAGGELRRLDGTPLRYAADALENPAFVAHGDAAAWRA